MINNTKIPKGYKQTSVGVIPENWHVKQLKECIEKLEAGVSVNSEDGIIDDQSFGILKTSAVVKGLFLPNESKKIPFNEIARAKVNPEKNSIIISRMNTPDLVGECAYVAHTYPKLFLPDRLWQMNFNKDFGIDARWLNFLFNTSLYRTKIKSTATGTSNSMKNISKSSFLSMEIPFPPLVEQIKISKALNTWNEAISNTKKIIETLKNRNKALAQQLLTGQKRLKGFKGKWELLPLNYFAKEQSIKNKSNISLTVLSCTKHNGLVPSLEYFGRKIFSDDLSTYKIVEKNSFAYATNHIEEGSIGYQRNYDFALISPMYTVFKTDDRINDEFLFRVLKLHSYIHEYKKRMEGSIDRRGGLRWDEFAKIKVAVPIIEEQYSINEFLELINEEQKMFEHKLIALQNQKKGLMQKLLTGEIRVK